MRKLLFVVPLLPTLFACQWTADPFYPQIPDMGFESVGNIGSWLKHNIEYVDDDSGQYVQSPLETYEWRTGDCEDFAILMMYFIHTELGGLPDFIAGTAYGYGHAWVSYEEFYYESQDGIDVTNNADYKVIEVINYYEIMYHADVAHKSLIRNNSIYP